MIRAATHTPSCKQVKSHAQRTTRRRRTHSSQEDCKGYPGAHGEDNRHLDQSAGDLLAQEEPNTRNNQANSCHCNQDADNGPRVACAMSASEPSGLRHVLSVKKISCASSLVGGSCRFVSESARLQALAGTLANPVMKTATTPAKWSKNNKVKNTSLRIWQ